MEFILLFDSTIQNMLSATAVTGEAFKLVKNII